MQPRILPILLSLLAAGAVTPAAASALTPDEVVVLFNPKSPLSLRVARYYVAARRIPQDHLVPIITDPGEGITEELYRTSFVPQVQKALKERNLTETAKCIVTTYDMPIRIFGRQVSPVEKAELEDNQKQMNEAFATLEAQTAAYDAVARDNAPPAATLPATTQDSASAWQTLVPKLNTAANAAVRRMDMLSPAARGAALTEFLRVQERVAGIGGLVSILRVAPDGPGADVAQRRLKDLTTVLNGLEEQAQGLIKSLDTAASRKQLVLIRTKSGGLVGQVRTLEEISLYLKAENTESCLDNELALVLSRQNYPRSNWVLNPQNIETYATVQRLPPDAIPRTILVARVDGLTAQAAEEMILTTIKTETAGLQGKMYIDARGLHGTDAYSQFDADLRKTADWLKQHSTMEVVLDDKPELIQAKDAPSAALYCGWYSLRSYQESGQWVKGAVGYHVASSEMVTLHDPKESGWVTNLLQRGFCGTMGPTDEPYLTSFPKPSLFFPLLVSGEFTQGEVWQVTAPMVSWRVGFVGDPLYNPFKVKPRVKAEDLRAHPILRNAYAILRNPAATRPNAATPPSTRPATARQPDQP